MALTADGDKGVGHTFGLQIDGVEIKSITEISGLKMEQDAIELKENSADGKFVTRKLPGVWKTPDITLKRGLSGDNSFDKWIKDSQFGKMGEVRKGGAIIVYDYEGAPVKRYKLTNAWPKSLEVGPLQSGGNAVLQETLVVTCERFEVE